MEYLPGVQDRGGAQTIGTLEFGNRDPIDLTQVVECIAGLNEVGDPAGRRAARHRSLGGQGRDVNDGTRK